VCPFLFLSLCFFAAACDDQFALPPPRLLPAAAVFSVSLDFAVVPTFVVVFWRCERLLLL